MTTEPQQKMDVIIVKSCMRTNQKIVSIYRSCREWGCKGDTGDGVRDGELI